MKRKIFIEIDGEILPTPDGEINFNKKKISVMNATIKNNRVFKIRSRVKSKVSKSTEKRRAALRTYFQVGYTFPLNDIFLNSPFSIEDVLKPGRNEELKRYRQILTFYLYMNEFSLIDLGELLEQNHSTADHSIKKVKNALDGFDNDLFVLLSSIVKCGNQRDTYSTNINEREIECLRQMDERFFEKYANFV